MIGPLLVYVAYALARDIRGLLIGQAARPDRREATRRTICGFPEVDEVVKLLTMATGPNSILVAARIDLATGIASDRVEDVSDEIDRALRDAVPEIGEVFIDAPPRRTESPPRPAAPSPRAARG